ncbi:MAG: class III signal peptide-containing protein [Candidatus Diapherotrites archaeon]
MKSKKGQGALEYLLLIGAALIVVTIVIMLITRNAVTQECESKKTLWYTTCASKAIETLCSETDIDGDGLKDCQWNSTTKTCEKVARDPC